MRYVEAPTEYDGVERPALFLAGGISGTENWQAYMTRLLADLDLVLLNPRRRAFPAATAEAATAQIEWEYRHLLSADAVLFWFPPETLCPIALYELGAQTRSERPLFVGADSAYQRCRDLEVQLRLARPELEIVSSLEKLAAQVRAKHQTGGLRKEVTPCAH